MRKSQVVRFTQRHDANMHVIRELDDVEHISAGELAGAYVKLTPTLKASERASFDAAGYEERIRALGARAVVSAPIIVPDRATSKTRAASAHKTAAQWLSEFVASLHGIEPELAESALAEALSSADEAGL